nr:RNA-directed DNA polymerase, eukaryota, reverse transcriptase zinc-binding domain protein [Tanacetum cinerariifolium]
MNCISINIQGFGELNKRRWVKDLCNRHMVNFLALQETKTLHVDVWSFRWVWGNSYFDFSSASARGKARGIICIWNSLVFQMSSIHCNENYVVVEGLWTPKDVRIMWIVVYAPQNLYSKIALLSSLANIIANWHGILITMGDFNEVRTASERYGSTFNERNSG